MTFQVGLRKMGWGCNKKICKQRVPVQLKLHDFMAEPRQWICSFCGWCLVDLFANVLKQTHYFTRWRQVRLCIQVEGLVNEAKANNKCWSQLTTSGRCSWNLPDGRSVCRNCKFFLASGDFWFSFDWADSDSFRLAHEARPVCAYCAWRISGRWALLCLGQAGWHTEEAWASIRTILQYKGWEVCCKRDSRQNSLQLQKVLYMIKNFTNTSFVATAVSFHRLCLMQDASCRVLASHLSVWT